MFGWMGWGSGWAEQEQQREAARQHTSDELELDRVVVHSLAASLINQSIRTCIRLSSEFEIEVERDIYTLSAITSHVTEFGEAQW